MNHFNCVRINKDGSAAHCKSFMSPTVHLSIIVKKSSFKYWVGGWVGGGGDIFQSIDSETVGKRKIGAKSLDKSLSGGGVGGVASVDDDHWASALTTSRRPPVEDRSVNSLSTPAIKSKKETLEAEREKERAVSPFSFDGRRDAPIDAPPGANAPPFPPPPLLLRDSLRF